MTLRCVQWIAIILGPALAFGILIAHFAWAVDSDSGANFQRGGALVVLVEFLLFAIVRSKLASENSQAWLGGRPESNLDIASSIISVVVATVGTVTWGYGDLFFDQLVGP